MSTVYMLDLSVLSKTYLINQRFQRHKFYLCLSAKIFKRTKKQAKVTFYKTCQLANCTFLLRILQQLRYKQNPINMWKHVSYKVSIICQCANTTSFFPGCCATLKRCRNFLLCFKSHTCTHARANTHTHTNKGLSKVPKVRKAEIENKAGEGRQQA